MKYLLDSDAVIGHLRKRERLQKVFVEEGSISIITFGELAYGAYKSMRPDDTLRTVQNFLNDFSIPVLPLDQEIMLVYAQIKAQLEVSGKRLDEFDLLIGATAQVHHLSLVTRNRKHFERIPGLSLFRYEKEA